MPYIGSDRIENLSKVKLEPGDLNYLITKRILSLIENAGESYGLYNRIIGFLEFLKINQYNRKHYYNCVEISFFESFANDVTNIIEENNHLDMIDRIGVLTCVQHELYRRLVSVYEDKKKEMNGDVFELSNSINGKQNTNGPEMVKGHIVTTSII